MDIENIKVLISEEELDNKIRELGKNITQHYKPMTDEIVAICVLKGSINFFSDLVKRIDMNVFYNFIQVSSYSGTNTTGKIKVKSWLEESLEGKHVLIVEDIVDTGNTLKYVIKYIERQKPASIEVASIVVKDVHEHGIDVKFPGFTIGDYFIIGYGLDYDQSYRNIPFIGYVE
ncbi:hypoxanthine phosphoribosyltransferase [Tepiditoga spiralis]|uniref:Hypoxanthine phosphoribosyltransferase n=1 Tax=Tepiditoga spiralis TaxID=2108365 RepID=A0A7G1G7U6_9BACT|nr:hypoxanthine phosphoribosyltransferase [Tepiditoga spiralis]BBE31274.1 hypoxanthine phosphoribosyltransferase [Tepiditoga spiralis]